MPFPSGTAGKIGTKLDAGTLPREVKSRMFAGYGTGLSCDACETPIANTQSNGSSMVQTAGRIGRACVRRERVGRGTAYRVGPTMGPLSPDAPGRYDSSDVE